MSRTAVVQTIRIRCFCIRIRICLRFRCVRIRLCRRLRCVRICFRCVVSWLCLDCSGREILILILSDSDSNSKCINFRVLKNSRPTYFRAD